MSVGFVTASNLSVVGFVTGVDMRVFLSVTATDKLPVTVITFPFERLFSLVDPHLKNPLRSRHGCSAPAHMMNAPQLMHSFKAGLDITGQRWAYKDNSWSGKGTTVRVSFNYLPY